KCPDVAVEEDQVARLDAALADLDGLALRVEVAAVVAFLLDRGDRLLSTPRGDVARISVLDLLAASPQAVAHEVRAVGADEVLGLVIGSGAGARPDVGRVEELGEIAEERVVTAVAHAGDVIRETTMPARLR